MAWKRSGVQFPLAPQKRKVDLLKYSLEVEEIEDDIMSRSRKFLRKN